MPGVVTTQSGGEGCAINAINWYALSPRRTQRTRVRSQRWRELHEHAVEPRIRKLSGGREVRRRGADAAPSGHDLAVACAVGGDAPYEGPAARALGVSRKENGAIGSHVADNRHRPERVSAWASGRLER